MASTNAVGGAGDAALQKTVALGKPTSTTDGLNVCDFQAWRLAARFGLTPPVARTVARLVFGEVRP
jgi:hypothetical protein